MYAIAVRCCLFGWLGERVHFLSHFTSIISCEMEICVFAVDFFSGCCSAITAFYSLEQQTGKEVLSLMEK